MRYDPSVGPDPTAWLDLGEGGQLKTVLRDHEREEADEGSFRMHAVIHATVETQLAQGHENASAALARLLEGGLDRHDSVHAIGRVLATQIFQAMQGEEFDGDEYNRDLDELTPESWQRMAEED